MKKLVVILIAMGAFFSSCKKEHEISYAAQLANDEMAIDNFLATNGISAIADSSGIRFVAVVVGTGKKVTLLDTVALNVTATYLNGTVISTNQTGALYLPYDLVTGLQYGLLKMTKGSTYVFYVPSGLAWGTQGNGVVGPNTNVIFTVTLRDDDAERRAEDAIIDHLLEADGGTFIKDTSGVRITFQQQGGGDFPTHTSFVKINYSASILGAATPFDSGTGVGFAENDTNYIQGLRIGLRRVPVGSSATIYVPSKLAYGYTGTDDGVIPGNSILVFTVTLISSE